MTRGFRWGTAVVMVAGCGLVWLPRVSAARGTDGACQRQRGYDLAPDRAVRLMWQRADSRDFRGSRLVGCIQPRGKVRTIVTIPDTEPGGSWPSEAASVREVAGASVLLDRAYNDHYMQRRWSEVINIKTGGHYTVASHCSGDMCGYRADVRRRDRAELHRRRDRRDL
jgi:hypothetical protein